MACFKLLLVCFLIVFCFPSGIYTYGASILGPTYATFPLAASSFKLYLDTKPSGTVTVTSAVSDSTILTIDQPSVKFTSANYQQEKAFTVRGLSYGTTTVTFTADDVGTAPLEVLMTITPAAVVSPSAFQPIITSGSSSPVPVLFYLNSVPSSPVDVILSNAENCNAFNPPKLTFDATDYYLPKSVTVSCSNIGSTLVRATASQSGGSKEFNDVFVDVQVDAIVPEIVIPKPRTYVRNSEYTIPISLSAPPVDTLQVDFDFSGAALVDPMTPPLIFTSQNWNVPQDVVILTLQPSNSPATIIFLPSGSSEFDFAQLFVTVVSPVVRFGTQNIFLRSDKPVAVVPIILNAEPTSPVTCKASAFSPNVASVSASGPMSGWEDDAFVRLSYGSGQVTVTPGAVTTSQGLTSIQCIFEQGGFGEFDQLGATAIVTFGVIPSTTTFYNDVDLHAVVFTHSMRYVVDPLIPSGSGLYAAATKPTCVGANTNVGTLSIDSFDGTSFPVTIFPKALGFTSCDVVSSDSGYNSGATVSYSFDVIDPQVTVNKLTCALNSKGCPLKVTFSRPIYGSAMINLDVDGTIASAPMVIANMGDLEVVLSVQANGIGETSGTISFSGSGADFDQMTFPVDIVVVTPVISPLYPIFSTSQAQIPLNAVLVLSGKKSSGVDLEITCTSADPSVAGDIHFVSSTTAMLISDITVTFLKPGIVKFSCLVSQTDNLAPPNYFEYHGATCSFYAERFFSGVVGEINELALSPTLYFHGKQGVTAQATLLMRTEMNSPTATATLNVLNPSIASIDVSSVVFSSDVLNVPQIVTVTTLAVGITQIEVSLGSTRTNYITINNVPVIEADVDIEQPQCNGDFGSISVTKITVGSGTYTYTWLPQGTASSTSVSHVENLAPGDYSLQIDDGVSVPYFKAFTINAAPAKLTAVITSNTNVTCVGANDGTISVTAGGGTSSYKYTWNDVDSSLSAKNGLGAGLYTIKVSDTNDCPAVVLTTTIYEAASALTLTNPISHNPLCTGTATGDASVDISGGGTPYTISWNNNVQSTTSKVTGLVSTAAPYQITVTDSFGCVKTQSFPMMDPLPVTASFGAQTNVICYENGGSATVVAGGGATPYSYSWNNGATSNQETATGLHALTYTATVTDKNGCKATLDFIITGPTAPLLITPITTNNTCGTTADGSVEATVSGGTTSYSYNWNNHGFPNAQKISNLPPGTYALEVTDGNQCKATYTYTISAPDPFSVSTTFPPIKCYGGSVNLTAIASGGRAPYTYSWLPAGGSESTSTLVPTGIYRVQGQDKCGVYATQSVIVPQPTPLRLVPAQTNVKCHGDDSGTATVYASGGTPGYSYSWSPYGGTSSIATGLKAGIFTVTVTDANGCQDTETYIISEPDPVAFTYTKVPIKCYGAATGSAAITVAGGEQRYLFRWQPSVSDGPKASKLYAGTYEVTVTDSAFCSSSQDIVISQPDAPLAITPLQTNVPCYGGTATATANVTGGTPGYTYSWTPSGGTAATATGLTAGTYVVTVTDANGCTQTHQFVISQPAPLVVSGSQRNVTCKDAQNGVATAKVSGGTLAYSYAWSGSDATNSTLTGISGGLYSVVVTDANMCTATRNFTIYEPSSTFSITVDEQDNECKSASNGSLVVNPYGGFGNYTFKWSTGETANARSNLTAGAYHLTIKDAGGCTKQFVLNVTEPETQFCQNNGLCVANQTCVCQGYWNGTDCSSPVCPIGCLNGGICTGPNICTCADGFGGIACSKTSDAMSLFVGLSHFSFALLVILLVGYLG